MTKTFVLIIAALAACALGGAAVAGAVGNDGGGDGDRSGRGGSEETLTGTTADRVREAALAEVPGATVERLEADAQGNAAYEAHLVRADGMPVTVYVNTEFEAVDTEGGGPGGHGAPGDDRGPHGPGGDEEALTGDTAAQVREAALAELPGATVERVETDAGGNAAYEAHVTRADGTPATVYVNRQFEVVAVEEGGGFHP